MTETTPTSSAKLFIEEVKYFYFIFVYFATLAM